MTLGYSQCPIQHRCLRCELEYAIPVKVAADVSADDMLHGFTADNGE